MGWPDVVKDMNSVGDVAYICTCLDILQLHMHMETPSFQHHDQVHPELQPRIKFGSRNICELKKTLIISIV